jgi:hypothetical protein
LAGTTLTTFSAAQNRRSRVHESGSSSDAFNTALRAVGVDHEMGEVSGVVDELLP